MIIPFVLTFIIAVPPKGPIIIRPKTNTIVETLIKHYLHIEIILCIVINSKKINSNNNNNNSSNNSNFNNNNSYYHK